MSKSNFGSKRLAATEQKRFREPVIEAKAQMLRHGRPSSPSGPGRDTRPIVVLGGGASHEIFLHDLHDRYGAFTLLDVNPDAPGRQWAERFFPVSIYDFEACRTALSPFIGRETQLVTFATGPAGDVCRRLCEAFNLAQRSARLAAAANNKLSLADILARQGLRVPRQMTLARAHLQTAQMEHMTFPAILKPVHGGGGLHVGAVENAAQAIRLCRDLDRPLLLQEKLFGREELLWLIVRKGRVAALVHGENLFHEATGWNSPLGLAMTRVPVERGVPPRWRKLAGELIEAFGLEDDFIVAELITDQLGETIIDVELNGLSAFACSNVLERNLLGSLLVDTYLRRNFSGPETAGWSSCMAFFAAGNPQALERMAQKAARVGGCVVEPPRSVSKLNCFGKTVYKGGYLIITDADDMAEAADKARTILLEAAA